MENTEAQRSLQDYRNWNKHLVNQQYYEINPQNKNEYRTLFINMNGLSGKPQIRYLTNYVVGTPPEHMKAIHPMMVAKIKSGNYNVPF